MDSHMEIFGLFVLLIFHTSFLFESMDLSLSFF
jgi:hypothetical protein